jgi:hypothetical protein
MIDLEDTPFSNLVKHLIFITHLDFVICTAAWGESTDDYPKLVDGPSTTVSRPLFLGLAVSLRYHGVMAESFGMYLLSG